MIFYHHSFFLLELCLSNIAFNYKSLVKADYLLILSLKKKINFKFVKQAVMKSTSNNFMKNFM